MKKALLPLLILLAALALLAGGTVSALAADSPHAPAAPDPEFPGTPHAVEGYIVVRGFEWGPGVNKIIVALDREVDALREDEPTVVTSHYNRTVTDMYLSDHLGNRTRFPSRYVSFELETSFDCTGSPFEMDMETEHNIWADEYIVDAAFTVEANHTYFPVRLTADCIENRVCPELERFSVRGSYSGDYVNPLTQETETQTLQWAAYEPDSLRSWEQNPLIIWLHGRGEGGEDIEKTILGNEVSALTETDIQSHFVSGDQTGAYVLVVQTPTYWMDGGDGKEGRGDTPSRYTAILMDTIWSYLRSNDDVDPDRIYLIGGSNGGFMTLEMLLNYPGFFAAGVPCSASYASQVYARDWLGNYRTAFGVYYIQTRVPYFTEGKAARLKDTPLWFVAAMTDAVIPTFEYTVPVYQAILRAGADNCWCSTYFGVVGTESSDTVYLGHWSWVYLLNDQVAKVQDPDGIRDSEEWFFRGFRPSPEGGTIYPSVDGVMYTNLFDWLNDQVRDQ